MTDLSLSPEMIACIKDCTQCHLVCLNMATGHCLQKGGRHAQPEHVRTMLVCAEVCRAAAFVMATGATPHRQLCAVCADICGSCIASCRNLDDMDDCIDACERCKASCEQIISI